MISSILIASLRRGAALLALAGMVTAAQAQTGDDAFRFSQRFPATGARMIGLAGTGVAGVADYSAFFVNPAGLGLLRHSEITGSLNAFSTTEASVYQTPDFSNAAERDFRATRLGNFAYLHKVPTARGSLVVGAAYNQVNTFDRNLIFSGANATNSISDAFLPYGNEYEVRQDAQGPYPRFFNTLPELAYGGGAIEFLAEEVPAGNYPFYQAVAPGTKIDQSGDVTEEGRMNELNFGGAAEAARGVMVGLSANLVFGTYQFTSLYEEEDTYGENTEDLYIVVLSDGELRGFDYLRYEQGFTSDLTGINLRAGLSSQIAPSLRLGLALETPTYYSVTESYRRSIETFFDVGGSLEDSNTGEFEYRITTPWRLSAGLAYKVADLRLSADAEYVDWSQLELDAPSDAAYFAEVNRDIRDRFDPVFNTRFGAEYRLGNLALRGGVAFQPDPRGEQLTFESGQTDRAKTFYSFGVGYRFAEQLIVDFGWMQEQFDDRYRPYADVETAPPVVEENVTRNRFAVGLRIAL